MVGTQVVNKEIKALVATTIGRPASLKNNKFG
jgi:hypothetical protein